MRTCQNCGKPITSNSRGAKWCSNACKTIAYRKRKGIDPPAFLTTKRKAFLTPDEEREIQRLQLEAVNYEKILSSLEEVYAKWHRALLLFETYGKNEKDYYRLDPSHPIQRSIDTEIGFATKSKEHYTYRDVSNQVQSQQQKIAEIEKEFLQRQRRARKIIDGASARDEAKKGRKKNGAITGADLAKMKFDTLPFVDQWKELIGEPSRNFYGLVWGDAKAGKSYFSLSLAQYLTQFGSVAYIAAEEGKSETMRKKVVDLGVTDVQIIDTRELTEITKEIVDADFVIIDSATKIDLEPQDLSFLRETYPDIAFLVLLQSVKEGANFKGSQGWKHDAEFVIKVERVEGKTTRATCEGRFGGGSIEYSY